MPASTKTSPRQRPPRQKRRAASTSGASSQPATDPKKTTERWWSVWQRRRKNYLEKRPHRSFRVTRRRDYARALAVPGYWSFTAQVLGFIKANSKLFFIQTAIYAAFTLLLVGIMSEETYTQLKTAFGLGPEDGHVGVGTIAALFLGVMTGQLAGTASTTVGSSQQVIAALAGLFIWLSTIWLIRAVLAGSKPRVRDGLYNSGGPVVALVVLMLVLLVQLLPAALAVILYIAADNTGVLANNVALMLAGGAALLAIIASFYWATSTWFAMILVTLPGMYPWHALRLAGEVVMGRRVRILLRLVWLIVLLLLMWAVVLIPMILLDGALKAAIEQLDWLPFVPLIALVLAACSTVFAATYVYLLYRKVVDADGANT